MNVIFLNCFLRLAPAALGLFIFAISSQLAFADTKTRSSSFEYNPANGLLSKEVIEPDAPSSCLQTSYSYDASGNKTSASASSCQGASAPAINSANVARTSTSSYTYTAAQTVVTSTNALGQTESRTIERNFGQVLSLIGPNALPTTWSYDPFGRKTRETRADNTKTTWDYQYCTSTGMTGTNVVACPAMAKASHVAYYVVTQKELGGNNAEISPAKLLYTDALGRTLRSQTTDFAGNTIVQDTEYNDLGQVERTSQIYVLGASPIYVTYTYDDLGRVLTQTSPDSTAPGGVATTSNSYNGLTTSTTNAKGQTKTTLKNAQGQTASVVDNQGGVTSYAYDALGQLVQTNAAGSITTLGYNQRGQKVSMIDPAMGAWTYSYNVFGELVSQTDSLQQTSTMAYDRLGRMTNRTEPDLTSNWYYDTKADGSACGKSAGKLCQATAANGYSRVHNYDSLGRGNSTSTVLDSASSPATISATFDTITGRLATKTWPTGYSATYNYNSMGYLASMVGGSGGGSTFQSARIDILNYDSQGRITSYKHGNNVVTNKTYTADTGRLTAVQATLNGSGCTNCVQSMGYSYDSLGNLTQRNDGMIGWTETFTYDSLNRLNTNTILGGGVGAAQTTGVQYDARGNISYKSDVGQYWYDTARPNRLTNITLSAPSGASPLTGTRALAFAFDDYKPTATNVNGTTMGNGNLMYTVSQDTSLGKHTVRFESYTSFNMPLQIEYANLINTSAGVSAGALVAATPNYSCAVGQTLSGTNCTLTTSTPSTANGFDACGALGTLQGANCVLSTTVATSAAARLSYSCDNANFYWANPGTCNASDENGSWSWSPYTRPNCPSNQTLSGANCLGTVSTTTTTPAPIKYSCPATHTKIGTGAASTCQITTTQAAALTYSCSAGYSLSGNQCRAVTNSAASGANGTSSDRTLSFIYGPEHQRIRQITTLTNNAPSQYQAGTVWYLNGEDGQSLTYEKEVKASGITEHKHYLQAAGMTFALYTQRTGAGVTTDGTAPQAASTSYSCPSGQTLSGTNCIVPVNVPPAPSGYACAAGTVSGSNCIIGSITSTAATPSYNCPKPTATASQLYVEFYGLNAANTSCYFDSLVPTAAWDEYQGGYTVLAVDAATATAINGAGYTCTATPGYGRAGCSRVPIVSYSCQSGQTLSGTGAGSVCTTPAPQPVPATPVFACLAGQTTITIGGTAACQTSVSTAAITTYSCPSGYGPQTTASGTVCMASSKLSTAAQSTRYFQQDHLGSTVVITDEAGAVVERLSYDAWGKRRNANGLPDPADSLVGLTTDRGYTEHEHLDEVGVIHMNGRVFDPLVGRFMSADPFIQAPFELQSHNRYAYVMNNPLAFTDPSGYFSLGGLIKTAIVIYVAVQTGTWVGEQFLLGGFASGGTAFATGGWQLTALGGATAGAAGGFAAGFTGAMLGGSSVNQAADAGAKSGFSGALFGAAGTVGLSDDYSRYAAHMGAGCVSSVASGGKCGSGAAAALVGKYITNETDGWNAFNKGIAAVVSGGVGSVIVGGSFENGARTAAFGYLFNQAMTKMQMLAGKYRLEGRQRQWAIDNGWIDENGNKIDRSQQNRADAADMTGKISTATAYGAAGCVTFVICAPVVPTLAAVSLGTGALKDFVFDPNPVAFGVDFGVDKVLSTIGGFFRIPAWITTQISEGMKDSKELTELKKK